MIREANLDDSYVINELSHHLEYEPVSNETAFGRLKTVLESGTEKIWVLDRDHITRGWIHVFVSHRVASPSFVEIGGLVVSPQDRRNGLGRALVDYAKQWANENDWHLPRG